MSINERMKALVSYEMRTISRVALAGGCIVIFGLIILFGLWRDQFSSCAYIYDLSDTIIYDSFTSILAYISVLAYPGTAILAAIQSRDKKIVMLKEFTSSLPYRKNQLFLTKYFSGVLVISGMALLYLCGGLIIINTFYRGVIGPRLAFLGEVTVINMGRSTLLFYLSCITLYSICMMMQVLIRPRIAASFVGFASAIAPIFIIRQIFVIVEKTMLVENGFLDFGKLNDWFYLWRINLYSGGRSDISEQIFNTTQYFLYYVVVFCMIVVITLLVSCMLNTKQGMTDREVFCHPIVEKIFLFFIGLCFGLVMASISGGEGIRMFILIGVTGCLSAFLTQKAIGRFLS